MNIARFLSAGCAILATTAAVASSRVLLVSESDLPRYWMPQTVSHADPVTTVQTQDACVNIGYLIADDGRTSSFVALKTWSDAAPGQALKSGQMQQLVQIAASGVSQRRFASVGGKPRPVFTSATFAFGSSESEARDAVLSHCRIADLPAYVADAFGKGRKSSLLRSEYEREQRLEMGCTSFSSACVLAEGIH